MQHPKCQTGNDNIVQMECYVKKMNQYKEHARWRLQKVVHDINFCLMLPF